MTYQKSIIFFILLICTFTTSGQTEYNYSDELLTATFKTYKAADIELSYHIYPFLEERVVNELNDSSSFENPYDSLSNYITIKRSTDRLLKLYCWNERNHGCRWLSSTYVQFKTISGKIKTVNLEVLAAGVDEDAYIAADFDEDLYVTDLQQISINNEPHYLIIGLGGHCGNHKYAVARVYKIVDDTLVKCDGVFESKNKLEAGSNRSMDIEMKYNPETKILSYNNYSFDDEYGFYNNDATIAQWKLTKKGFKVFN